MAFTGTITNPSPGLYEITNSTGVDNVLYIETLVKNTIDTYSYEFIEEVSILDGDTYELNVPDYTIYTLSWLSSRSETTTIINTVAIDICILKLVDGLMCCNKCSDCQDMCANMKEIKTFIAITILYEAFQDLLEIHFGTPAVSYSFTTNQLNVLFTLNDILNKLSLFCSCNHC